jgi:hypothetical protein
LSAAVKVRPAVSFPSLSGPSFGCVISVPSTLTEVGGCRVELLPDGSTIRLSVRTSPPAAADTSRSRAIDATAGSSSDP